MYLIACLMLLFNSPQPKQHTMLCLGDSYTIGQSVEASERFPEQTVSKLADKSISFSTPEIIARTGWTCDELGKAIKQKNITTTFDAVTLLIGVNDQFRGYDTTGYAKDFEQLLKTAIQFANNKSAHVFVLSIPDYGVTPFAANARQTPGQIAADIDNFNLINKRIATKYNVNYIDITPISRKAASQSDLIAYDGLHPSGKMYGLWAEKLAEKISSLY